ncbi:MAG: hypothetical protein ACK5LO_07160 [Leucobacter sp.]
MKIRTRIVTAVTVALASVFVAAPAFAHDGEDHARSMFDTAGLPLNWVGISITIIVLLVIVLALAGWLSSLFEKK